ncbi:shikimate dehydrogenase [Curtobacterium sp. MCBD17_040]|uniref:shikimate dehydrogenase n=1 Tax=Curtobacterium sp. MCBD17_040 TaxID=2175674 RepID=UPI000DA995A4|nr:shikimate dehydrogenase [Curtobacterium sp. MCBD17_040]WIB64168.1 shikimate dehydrogenase [Curtobacterium sp. MCBD17_040]
MPAALPDPDRTRLAVLGQPIDHSLSPTLHAAAYQALGLDLTYERHEVGSGELEAFVGDLDSSWRGLSLTMPLKREVLPLLDRTTPLVDELGVANTLLLRTEAGRTVLSGANTDVDGIVRPVEALGHVPGAATILGGGATAASALFAALRLGASFVRVYLRDTTKASELVLLATRLGVTLEVHPLADLTDAPASGLVISTLPGGAADTLQLHPSGDDAVLFDVAYDPWPSVVAERWSAAGGRVLNGLDMLVEQAIGQIRFFTSGDADLLLPDEARVRDAMRASVGLSAISPQAPS